LFFQTHCCKADDCEEWGVVINKLGTSKMTQDEIKYEVKELNFVEPGKILIYKYIDFNGGISLIQNQSFKFSNPNNFNDPFDLYEELIDFSKQDTDFENGNLSRKEKRRIQNTPLQTKTKYLKTEWKKQRINYGISCFSKIYDNILMWSHYADKHDGICVGFLVDINKLQQDDFWAFAIDYKTDFTPLPYYNKDNQDRLKMLTQYLSVKAEFWSYEKEIRLINFEYYLNQKSDFINFSKYTEIKEIYLGLKMKKRNQETIKKLFHRIKNRPIIYNMTSKKNTFEIERINASA